MKKLTIAAFVVQLVIFITMLLRDHSLSLLSYINVSFVYGGILIFTGMLIYVVQGGFFDIFTISMRKAFRLKSTLDTDEMRPPSELLAIPFSPVLSVGSITILLMSAALFTYYL